jgi:hypothetical protein
MTTEEFLDIVVKKPFFDHKIIPKWSKNKKGLIDVQGSVDIFQINVKAQMGEQPWITKLPCKFGKVSHDFSCNGLTTLEGCPEKIGGSFYAASAKLTSLKGCPKEVGGSFDISGQNLTTLDHFPNKIKLPYIFLSGNKLNDYLSKQPIDFFKQHSFNYVHLLMEYPNIILKYREIFNDEEFINLLNKVPSSKLYI